MFQMDPCLHVHMDMGCLHVSIWIHVSMWSVYMSQCGYGHRVSSYLHVDMDLEWHPVTMCLHVSILIWTWSVCMLPYVMSPCAYGHGVSPCLHPYLHVDIDMECLHVSM